MDWKQRITAGPAVLVGRPVVKGTPIAVELVVEMLANGWSVEQVLANYRGLTVDDMRACLACTREVLPEERVYEASAT